MAGFVFVDASHEDQVREIEVALPGVLSEMVEANGDNSPEGMTHAAFVKGLRAVRDGDRSLGDAPVVVLSAGRGGEDLAIQLSAGDVAQRIEREKREGDARLAALSTNSALVVARDSGHMIPFEQPSLVARAVLEVVRAVREKDRVQSARIEQP